MSIINKTKINLCKLCTKTRKKIVKYYESLDPFSKKRDAIKPTSDKIATIANTM